MNPSRTERIRTHDVTFIGVDGEGVTRPTSEHDYVLFGVGSETLWNNGRQLDFDSIQDHLWTQHKKNPHAVFVGFFLGYDFTQWMKLLPHEVAYRLLHSKGIAERKNNRRRTVQPSCVVYGRWEFDILANRRWKLRPHTHVQSMYNAMCRNRTCDYVFPADGIPDYFDPDDFDMIIADGPTYTIPSGGVSWWRFRDVLKEPKPDRYMYVCDTGAFWQTSFLNVIDPKEWGLHAKDICSPEVYALIRAGKSKRDDRYAVEDTSYFDEMRRYNVLENETLSRVCQVLNRGFVDNEISIRLDRDDWYGPGRAAQKLLDMTSKRVSSVMAKDIIMPLFAREAAQSSYYGGWFEIAMHGHVGDRFEYDINSAYPYIIARLPCLHHGTWSLGNGPVPSGHPFTTFVHATCVGSSLYFGAMPHRDDSGHICRPHTVRGWYVYDEVLAAQEAGLIDTVDVDTWVTYEPCNCPSPFSDPEIGVQRIYDLRRAAKETEPPKAKALKLVINSLYGKFAQSIGVPKYGNPVYATLITAGTRCMILRAIATHPHGAECVAMVATDGIYFRHKHPTLDIGKGLGQWGTETKTNMTILMPGVYWDDASRQAVRYGERIVPVKSRGVSARDIARVLEAIDEQWDAFMIGSRNTWPSIEIPLDFSMVSAKSAIRGRWHKAGHVSDQETKKLSANPVTKRIPNPYWDGHVIRTHVKPMGHALDTVPYDKAFGWQDARDLEPEPDDELRDASPWQVFFRDGVPPDTDV